MLPLQGRRPLRQSMPSEAPEALRLFHQELSVKQTVVLIMTIHGITFSITPISSLGRDLGTKDTTKGKNTHWAEPDLLPWLKSYCTVTVFFFRYSSGWKVSKEGHFISCVFGMSFSEMMLVPIDDLMRRHSQDGIHNHLHCASLLAYSLVVNASPYFMYLMNKCTGYIWVRTFLFCFW